MRLRLAVAALDSQLENKCAGELRALILGMDAEVVCGIENASTAQIVFVEADARRRGELLSKIDRKGKAVIAVVTETEAEPGELARGEVDDVIVRPFRKLEVISRIKNCQQVLMWDEVAKLNISFSEVLEQLKDDLKLAERLQKSKLPIRFDDIRGFKVTQRYLAGLRSGGDHFDLAESQDGNVLSMVLSDSSSYGLSSAVLSVLMRVALRISSEEVRSTAETVRRIQEELRLVLGEKDKLSLFYGMLSRKDYVLKYLNRGSASVFYASPGKDFVPLRSQGDPFSRFGEPVLRGEEQVTLEPEGRLILLSDGFSELAGGPEKLLDILNERRKQEAADSLNELVFQVKSKFSEADDMPAQDCTAAIFDVDARVMRIAR